MRRVGSSVIAMIGAAAAACGGTSAFTLTSDDNNPQAIAAAAQSVAPAKGTPVNASGKPLAFLVTAGAEGQRKLVAYDLAANKQLWEVSADVTSRVVVGSRFVAAREGKTAIVARAIDDGRQLWSHGLGAKQEFLGAAADGDRVFYVVQDESGSKRTWYLVALGGDGSELWRADAPGTLGAPAARNGLVFMPFLTQWLTIIDGATGKQLARIRQTDEAVNYVRTTSDGVFYGSKGVFYLDEKSASGTKKGSTYGAADLPSEFVRIFYHWDAFNPVQAGYSAFDRNRLLWRASGAGGELKFADDLVVVFSYRFFFAFGASDGQLRWAHNHPRFDLVSVDHTGGALVYASQEGEIGALDPRTGGRLVQHKLGARLIGATFDADGFRPAGDVEPARTVEALSSIIWDRDARFQQVKIFALLALGKLPGTDVTKTLLVVLADENTPQPIYAKAAEVLIGRRDAESLPLLVEALKVRHDYIGGTRPRAVEVLARAIGAIGRPEGAPALIPHLEDPQTPLATIKDIADALAACKSPEALGPLRSFLLDYRSDPLFASDTTAIAAVIDALLVLGGGAERELVAYVADEPRTQPRVAEYARRALAQTTRPGQTGTK